ncbi:MAG: hypothetical protein ACI814_000263 [Mariniblastus sp.]|jgi:hypothetical protein
MDTRRVSETAGRLPWLLVLAYGFVDLRCETIDRLTISPQATVSNAERLSAWRLPFLGKPPTRTLPR